MNLDSLIGSILTGALGSRPRKRTRRSTGWVSSRTKTRLATTAVVAAASAAYDLWQKHQASKGQAPSWPSSGAPPSQPTSGRVPPAMPPASGGAPPVPVSVTSRTSAAPPPLPSHVEEVTPDAPLEVLRPIQVAIAAARADGMTTREEMQAVVEQARAVGAEQVVLTELERPTPLERIVGGVGDPRQAQGLYVMAFAIARADDDVNERERKWLDELARGLGLDASTVARLEADTAADIDASA